MKHEKKDKRKRRGWNTRKTIVDCEGEYHDVVWRERGPISFPAHTRAEMRAMDFIAKAGGQPCRCYHALISMRWAIRKRGSNVFDAGAFGELYKSAWAVHDARDEPGWRDATQRRQLRRMTLDTARDLAAMRAVEQVAGLFPFEVEVTQVVERRFASALLLRDLTPIKLRLRVHLSAALRKPQPRSVWLSSDLRVVVESHDGVNHIITEERSASMWLTRGWERYHVRAQDSGSVTWIRPAPHLR